VSLLVQACLLFPFLSNPPLLLFVLLSLPESNQKCGSLIWQHLSHCLLQRHVNCAYIEYEYITYPRCLRYPLWKASSNCFQSSSLNTGSPASLLLYIVDSIVTLRRASDSHGCFSIRRGNPPNPFISNRC